MTVVDSMVFDQNSKDKDLTLEFKSIAHGISVIFEQDSKVAYAYLLDREEVVSDVWLYNVDYAPQNPEWKNHLCDMPFRNSIQYVSCPVFTPINNQNEISIEWIENNDKNVIVNVFIRGELMGVLQKFCKPGWSKLSSVDSPIARVLNRE